MRPLSPAQPSPSALTNASIDKPKGYGSEAYKRVCCTRRPSTIMIGSSETLIVAESTYDAGAHLTIIPAALTESDVFEANKTASHIQQIFASFGREPLFRLLLTQVQPLASHAQKHALRELHRLKLPRLVNVLAHRAAYEEIGLSGLPPHFADSGRPTVAKALTELNALRDELYALLASQSPEAVPARTAGAA